MKMTGTAGALALGLAVLLAVPAAAQPADASQKLSAQAVAFEKGLHKQSGDVAIPAAHAVLHLADRYYFVPADEAKTILTKVWGNPPSSGDGVLGLVFEKNASVFNQMWSAVVTYEDTGYVSDKDAKTEDYDKVLQGIRDGEDTANAERQKSGYPTLHLVGWAQQPTYDPAAHALIWAKNISFSDSKLNTLNYDVRLLGRKGVLSLNMLSTMDHLADVHDAAKDFGASASFQSGSSYAEYDKSVDKTAEYGLAGLVAAGAGIVVAKKLGLLAVVFGFWKFILVGLTAAGAAIARFFRRVTGRERDTLEG